jgi:cellulase/cellobiase CelA1
MREVARHSTALWIDRIGAITAGRGLRGHLDEALRQQAAAGQPLVFQVVVYDLPNRDCAALASNGELKVSENGLAPGRRVRGDRRSPRGSGGDLRVPAPDPDRPDRTDDARA